MLSESEKRAALLAVSRYGADSSRVFLVVQSVLELRSQGDRADLLDFFQREQLLTAGQARELRFGLEKTLVDPIFKNGSAPLAPHAAETLVHRDPADAQRPDAEEENED